MSDKQNILKATIIFISSFLFLALGSNFGINIYDEGIGIVGSTRILDSELPYLDFWTIYSPLWFYIQAGFIKVFGGDILSLRLFTIFIHSVNIVIIYEIVRTQSKNALFAPIASLMLISLSPMYARAIPPAITLSLVLIYILINEKRAIHYLMISVLLPLLFAIRHDFGVYFMFVASISFFFEQRCQSGRNIKQALISIGLALVLLIGYFLILHYFGMLNKFIEYSLNFVLNNFAASRSLPLPNPVVDIISGRGLQNIVFGVWSSIVFYVPFCIIAASLVYFFKNKGNIGEEKMLLFVTLSASVVLLSQAATRSEYEHILPSLIMALPAVQILIAKSKSTNKYLIAALLVFFTLIPIAKKAQSSYNAYFSHNTISLDSPFGSNIKVDKTFGDEYNKLLRHILSLKSDKYIYSGCIRHDKIFINDILLYHLTGKKSATKYHELHPKQATEYALQNEIINNLYDKNVKTVVLYENDVYEKNASSISSNIFILDDYINDKYKLTAKYGKYYVFSFVESSINN